MKPGDVVEVEIEAIGLLRNPVVDECRSDTMTAAYDVRKTSLSVETIWHERGPDLKSRCWSAQRSR